MAWLKENYPKGTRLTAIICVYGPRPIIQDTLPENELKYDKSIRALFGDNVLEKFVFAHSKGDDDSWLFWKDRLVADGFFRGCKHFYVYRDKESALEVLNWAITLG